MHNGRQNKGYFLHKMAENRVQPCTAVYRNNSYTRLTKNNTTQLRQFVYKCTRNKRSCVRVRNVEGKKIRQLKSRYFFSYPLHYSKFSVFLHVQCCQSTDKANQFFNSYSHEKKCIPSLFTDGTVHGILCREHLYAIVHG